MFVVGAGLSTLETGADNFLAICGPPRYSEIRLNLAQGIQGVGSFVAPLLASRVFFSNTVSTKQGLKNVQWVYLGVAGFVALLIVLFFFAPMPEVTDADMHAQEGEIDAEDVGQFKKQYNLFLGVWSQFCYVGAQVAVANYFINFCQEAGYSPATSCKSPLCHLSIQITNEKSKPPRRRPRRLRRQPLHRFRNHDEPKSKTKMDARRLPRGLLHLRPRSNTNTRPHQRSPPHPCPMLRIGTSVTPSHSPTPNPSQICFATIFTLSLRGLGRHTKLGGSMLVAAISGGAAIPPMTGAVATRTGNFHTAMAVPTVFFVLSWIYPLYANFVNARKLDGHRATTLNVDGAMKVGGEGKMEEAFGGDEKKMEAETLGERRNGPPGYGKEE